MMAERPRRPAMASVLLKTALQLCVVEGGGGGGEPQVGTYEYLTSSKDTILNWDAVCYRARLGTASQCSSVLSLLAQTQFEAAHITMV